MTTLEIENKIENDVKILENSPLEKKLANSPFFNTDITTKYSDESFSATLQKAIDLSTIKDAEGLKDTDLNDKQFYYSSGPNYFLLEKQLKAETIKNIPINQVPFTPEWFMGIVNIRGVIMPVINIHHFVDSQTNTKNKDNKYFNYDSPKTQQSESYLLKLEHQNHSPIVLKVDSLPKQININKVTNRTTVKNKPAWILNTLDIEEENNKNTIIEIDHHQLLSQIRELS